MLKILRGVSYFKEIQTNEGTQTSSYAVMHQATIKVHNLPRIVGNQRMRWTAQEPAVHECFH